MKFSFVTLGCKVNLCETQGLMQLAQERGHEIVQKEAQAVIMNSCAVTAVSEHKNLRALHKARKENPDAVIAVIGCLGETNADKLVKDGTAQLIFGVRDRAAILDACEDAVLNAVFAVNEKTANDNAFEELPAGIPQGRTRALLKVEDGCNNFCSYCIIPYARGRVRSLTPEKAIKEANRLASEGVREIVVTGIEISSYGLDLADGSNLTDLVEALCKACPEVRFRLGSLEPRTVTDEFCSRLSRYENLAPHFHLSLQSGCDSVLKRMNRKYTCDEFRAVVKRLQESFRDCSITTDIIVGFPGETETEFSETCEFVKEIAFADVHVFPYSIRPGTKAAAMSGQLSEQEKKHRADQLRMIAQDCSEIYRKSFADRCMEVVPEHRKKNGVWAAHGPYSFPVYIRGTGLRKNIPVFVRLTELFEDGLMAEIVF